MLLLLYFNNNILIYILNSIKEKVNTYLAHHRYPTAQHSAWQMQIVWVKGQPEKQTDSE